MKTSLRYREVIPEARRIVVKVGSRALVQSSGLPDRRRMRNLCRDLAAIRKGGHEVVLVTSGAVGAGMQALGMTARPQLLPDLQMAAAVGQSRLMARYDELFTALGCRIGQVLLTHADFNHKMRETNIRRTLENLLRHQVIPIINENDVVTDEEIKADLAFGDNDYLASLVAKLIRADLLILLSTVDGLREPGAEGRTRRIRYLETITRKTYQLVTDSQSTLSKGGMTTKLKAAQSVSKSGCAAIIANGLQPAVLQRIMRGDDVGTLVLASSL
jgi:glutamate 5-kinase